MNLLESHLKILNQDLLRLNSLKGFEAEIHTYDESQGRLAAWRKLFYGIVERNPDEPLEIDYQAKENFIGSKND